ncbi:MAG: pilus assembly protein [Cyanobacteria bacterium NC_groundwater_1444_Ag_S-0.65um_54_12]|nr:pilus assembly protein [Cyanobacteria bacterium NC_groundwater_1444_Ag_S-0.65um_54_12]
MAFRTNCCTDGGAGSTPPRRHERRIVARRQGGQSLVELAIALPIGLLLLLGIGYLGRAMLAQQNVLVAARYAAREAALAALLSSADKFTGKGVELQSATAGARSKAASAAAGHPVETVTPDWQRIVGVSTAPLKALPVGPYGMAFVAKHDETVEGQPMHFGIGFMLYGTKVKQRLTMLEPIRRQAAAVARGSSYPEPGLAAPLEVSGTVFMPGEAPVRHPLVGMLDTNHWIKDILESDKGGSP